MKSYRKTILFNIRLNRIILVIFAILGVFNILLVRHKLLKDSDSLGNYLVWNYATEEQNNINIYQTFVRLGTESIDQKIQEGANLDEINIVLSDLFKNISETLNNPHINLYAIVNGDIISSNPAITFNNYDYSTKEWYKNALSADGKIIFTDIYKDAITDEYVFTISKKCEKSDNVLLFDIFIENYRPYSNETDLPSGSSYFLCDTSGSPLYFSSANKYSYIESKGYCNKLFDYINNNDDTVKDLDGKPHKMYYYRMSNGWICILTIPLDTILNNLHKFVILFASIFIIFFVIITFMTLRDKNMNRKISHITDTVQVLGDSYYAIYRVNYKAGTYESIKSAPDTANILKPTGDYQDLLDVLGTLVDKSTHDDFKESFSLDNIIKLVDKNIKHYGGYYLRRFDNTFKWVHVRMLVDKKVMPNEVVLSFREVDEEKKNQLKYVKLIETSLESAKQNEQSKSAFFSSMSHDMRTPLNVIINLSNLIEENISNKDKVLEYIKKIKFSSNQLLTLINDLLEISRLERTNISISNETIDLKEFIKECAETFSDIAQKENKTFNMQFDVENKIVIGDTTRIGQIVNNLLSNAFKYTETGDEISISLNEYTKINQLYYKITVSDTGIGISKDFLEHIFDSYSRETRFSSKNIAGTGLGMPIVKMIVQQMGGEITVDSQLGVGSTFVVTSPFNLAVKEEKIIESSTNNVCANKNITLSGKKILLAEDNEINMEIATEILQMEGIEVFPAFNGKQAVDIFKNHDENFFDAILMDMLMPEMNGCEVSKEIRKLNRNDAKTIPIIAVTANAFAEDIAKTTEAGMNAHISKPIDFNALCKTLKDLIKE